jgi:hypothetical protein
MSPDEISVGFGSMHFLDDTDHVFIENVAAALTMLSCAILTDWNDFDEVRNVIVIH